MPSILLIKKLIIVIIGIIMVEIIIGGLYLLKNDSLIYGKWACGSDLIVVFNKDKTFEFYNPDNKETLDINGKYTIDNTTKSKDKVKYNLTLKSTDRVINSQKLTELYTTEYEITMDKKNDKEMAMINPISYSIYYCTKVE